MKLTMRATVLVIAAAFTLGVTAPTTAAFARSAGAGCYGKSCAKPKVVVVGGRKVAPTAPSKIKTGFGGTFRVTGSASRTPAAGSQTIVSGLAPTHATHQITALPATGGAVNASSSFNLLGLLIAAALALIGAVLRRQAHLRT